MHRSAPGPWHVSWLVALCFCGTDKGGIQCIPDSFACSWEFPSYLETLSSLCMRGFPLSYWILFCPICLLCLGVLPFYEEETRVGIWRGGEVGKLGGKKEGKIVIGMYCRREKSIFN